MSLGAFATKNLNPIVFTTLVLCVLGAISYSSFPVSILPDVTFPRVKIIADSGDRPANMVEVSVTRPIEQAVATVPDVKTIRAKTQRGSTELSVDFNWGTDILVAEQLVNAKVNEVRTLLPASTKTEVQRMNPTIFPVVGLSLSSKSLSSSELWTLATYKLKPRLSRVQGVARVVIQGGRPPEVSVEVDPAKLASYHLSLGDVSTALAQANMVTSVGTLDERRRRYQVIVDALATTPQTLAGIAVAQRNGTAITLGQIAKVGRSVEDRNTVVVANGEECVLLNVVRQPSANSVALVDATNQELKKIRLGLPAGTHLESFYDQSVLIRDAVQSVQEAVLTGAVLAVFVLLIFLRDWRATLVTAAIIPATVLITFLLMRAAGLTLNLMTLGALAVGIGLVIDDAIVVVENVVRHLASDQPVAQVVQKATAEIAAPMVSSTLTTVVVFLPLALLQGVAGAFFIALAVTLSLALMVSLALALLLSPTLCASFLKSHPERPHGRMMGGLLHAYEATMRWGLKRVWIVPIIAVSLLSMTYFLSTKLGTGFMPEMDEGAFVLDYHTPAGTSLEESDRLLKKVDDIFKGTPEIGTYSRRTGTELGFSITEAHRGDYAVMLKTDRHRSIDKVMDEVRDRITNEIPGLNVEFVQVLQDLIGDLAGTPAPIEVKLFGENRHDVRDAAERLADRIGKIKGVVDVQSGVFATGPEFTVNVDPVRAGRIGLSPGGVADQLTSSIFGTVATSLLEEDRQIPVRVRFPLEYRQDADHVGLIPIQAVSGFTTPLSSLATITETEGGIELAREDQRRLMGVTARLDGIDLGSGVKQVQQAIRETPTAPGIEVELGGQFKSQSQAFANLALVLGLAVVLVYAVMLFQFRDFTTPTVILLVMPMATFGAVSLLWITKTALNVSSFMGMIMLAGVVVKNGILLLDRVKAAEAEGASTEEAILDAGRLRIRPILMTTLTALLGLAPLALGLGAGAEMQKPLAIAVIGGLSVSTLLTLVMGPLLYAGFRRVGSRFSRPVVSE